MTKVNPSNRNETKSDIFHGPYQIWRHIFFCLKVSKYFNDFENQNFSVLWLKWTQKKCKWSKIRHFPVGYIHIWRHILLCQKNIKVFLWLLRLNFSDLWLSWTQAMEMKLNQTYFIWEDWDLTSYIFCQKLLMYFNDF